MRACSSPWTTSPCRRRTGAELFSIPKLDVAQGERIVVLGRDGAGKSQLIRLLHKAMHDPEGLPGIRVSPSLALGCVDQAHGAMPGERRPRFHPVRCSGRRSAQLAVLAEADFPSRNRSCRSQSCRRARRRGSACWRCACPSRTSISWTSPPTTWTFRAASSWNRKSSTPRPPARRLPRPQLRQNHRHTLPADREG